MHINIRNRLQPFNSPQVLHPDNLSSPLLPPYIHHEAMPSLLYTFPSSPSPPQPPSSIAARRAVVHQAAALPQRLLLQGGGLARGRGDARVGRGARQELDNAPVRQQRRGGRGEEEPPGEAVCVCVCVCVSWPSVFKIPPLHLHACSRSDNRTRTRTRTRTQPPTPATHPKWILEVPDVRSCARSSSCTELHTTSITTAQTRWQVESITQAYSAENAPSRRPAACRHSIESALMTAPASSRAVATASTCVHTYV